MLRALQLEPEKCTGCLQCEMACSYENEATGKVIKCDLCGGDPWCAKACPTGAITYVDMDHTGLERMRAWAQQSQAGTASFNAPVAKDVQSFGQAR